LLISPFDSAELFHTLIIIQVDTMRLYNCTAAFVPKDECIYLFGDNSEHSKPNPWQSAIRIVHLLGMATDEVDHYRVARHYTIRLATSPKDDGVLKPLQNARVQEQYGSDINPADLPDSNASSSSVTMLACRILVDGGDDHSSEAERLRRVPQHLWHPNPMPPGRSAISMGGLDGKYVLMQDIPKPVLEEEVVGFVGLTSLPFSSSNEEGGGYDEDVEIGSLYVDPAEHECLGYVLVELMAEYAKSTGKQTLRLAPVLKTETAGAVFEKAGRAAKRVKAGDGSNVEVWEMDLDAWTPPTTVIVL
jgi:hypothetical protein